THQNNDHGSKDAVSIFCNQIARDLTKVARSGDLQKLRDTLKLSVKATEKRLEVENIVRDIAAAAGDDDDVVEVSRSQVKRPRLATDFDKLILNVFKGGSSGAGSH
ncbi:hypothetical protein KEM55_004573, partial [Ascosphaera atra]